jgi:benzoyl-CoA reductase/2-hydroxyglutaryl-CoA dehydratase subunit BcrC/BadD/HgdB
MQNTCDALQKEYKVLRETILKIIETPVRDDYSKYIRNKHLQNTIKDINVIKKQIYDKC